MIGRAIETATGTAALLRGIWAAGPAEAWTVGDGGTILRWDGARWAAVESGTSEHLQAVHGCAPDEAWAVGWSGTVLRWDGRRWARQAAPAGREVLAGVWVRARGDVWIAGGTAPVPLTPGLWGHPGGGAWLVGQGGCAHFFP